jgi:dTDP-4-amino-4,6-dideoxygalactose transaminase
MNIPFFGLDRQYANLKEELLKATDHVLASGQLMNGPYTSEFELWLAQKNKRKYAITCHSGTQALEIIAAYWYEVFKTYVAQPLAYIPSFTFPATVNAFINTGWDIELVDCNKYGKSSFKSGDNGKNLYVMVGLYGAPTRDYTHYWRTAQSSNHIIIEDAAQHWLSDNCKRHSHAAAISFDPTKNLPSSGNGGAIITSDDNFAKWARSYRQHGNLDENITGINSRMSETDCAHMLVRAQHIDEWQTRRQEIATMYNKGFSKHKNVSTLIKNSELKDHACQKYVINIDYRDEVLEGLKQDGIECKVHYQRPLHEYKMYENYSNLDMLSKATVLSRRVLSLPMYPELSNKEVKYIIKRVRFHTSV